MYEKVSIPPERFSECAGDLFSRFDAFNVTAPYKQAILPFLNKTEGEAARLKSVNTVLTKPRTGYNTDGFGFSLMLKEAGVKVNKKRVLVLGTGGAGKSVACRLLGEGASVFLYNRTHTAALRVAEEIGGTPVERFSDRAFDVVINCTGVGMNDSEGLLPIVRTEEGLCPASVLFKRCEAAVDLIYAPKQSAFLKAAEDRGIRTVNGEAMLFYQAYLSACIYLGRKPYEEEAQSLYHSYGEGEE